MNIKVAILADSLALPRGPADGDLRFEATYPFVLHQRLRAKFGDEAPYVIDRGKRLRTMEDVVYDWGEFVELTKAEVVIVQAGVVDCAPRVFLPREHKFVEGIRSESLRNAILRFVNKHRRALVLMRPDRVYVPVPRFRRAVEAVVKKARDCKVGLLVFVNIVIPPGEIEYRSPGFQKNVTIYNRIICEQADGKAIHVIDTNSIMSRHGGPERLTSDGVHLTGEASNLLADILGEHIAEFVVRNSVAALF
jgi:lysophospholipase L1-like esterase